MNENVAELFVVARTFYEAADELAKEPEALLIRSREILGLHDDPIDISLSSHRQLQDLDENAYSDWLAWILQQVARRRSRPLRFFEALFSAPTERSPTPDPESEREKISWTVHREYPVPEGHEGHSGRLDILVEAGQTERAWHIEVKVCDADSADLGKHGGYAESLKEYRNCNHILLVTEHRYDRYPVDPDAPRGQSFVPLRWKDLCLRLRSWVAKSDQKGLTEATALFFCAMVEEKLLGISPRSLRQMKYIRDSLRCINGSG